MGKAADRLGRVGRNLRTLPDEGVQWGTKEVRRAVLQSLARDAGPDRKLSGIRNGVPQTVKTTRRSSGQLVEGRVMAGPARQRAPWFWMEEGTLAGDRRRRRGKRTGEIRSFYHPGTPAKRTWSRAVPPATERVRKNFEKLYRKALEG